MILPITLCSAAAAALLSIWLSMRIGLMRQKESIMHGDGDNALLARRMRAQANFVEYTPFFLLLVAGIEIAGHGFWWLAALAALYMAGRIFHAIGMDPPHLTRSRQFGMGTTLFPMLALAIYAVLLVLGLV